MTAQNEAKKLAGRRVIEEFVRDGMKLGLGSGTTSHFFVRELGKHVAEGLRVTCTTTSRARGQRSEPDPHGWGRSTSGGRTWICGWVACAWC